MGLASWDVSKDPWRELGQDGLGGQIPRGKWRQGGTASHHLSQEPCGWQEAVLSCPGPGSHLRAESKARIKGPWGQSTSIHSSPEVLTTLCCVCTGDPPTKMSCQQNQQQCQPPPKCAPKCPTPKCPPKCPPVSSCCGVSSGGCCGSSSGGCCSSGCGGCCLSHHRRRRSHHCRPHRSDCCSHPSGGSGCCGEGSGQSSGGGCC
ncbi:hypothetical protein FD755_001447 [Muntiacus reevesi]|uniref:IGFBP N-terminal domain-containing protein n=1 Tax=Muntiacus reevesi TaxID=9886 RepID=A0A5J5N1G7_MUNRE|nr:hypothetical protein FD755_001447 [Muntiacus reevesi]